VDIKKLIDFKINAAYARTSILGFVEILRSKGDGFADRGDESKDLGIQDNIFQPPLQSRQATSNNREESMNIVPGPSNGGGLYTLLHTDSTSAENRLQNSILSDPSASQQTAPLHFAQDQRQEDQLQHADRLYSLAPNEFTEHGSEQQSLDVCRPFFDPTMLDLFPNGEMPDLSHFETSLLSLDYFELDDWNTTSNLLDDPSEN
jgi:hypothetical protein